MIDERNNCGACDSNNIELKTKRSHGTSKKGNEYDFEKSYFECHECGFEFVTYELSQINLQKQKESIEVLQNRHAQTEYHSYAQLVLNSYITIFKDKEPLIEIDEFTRVTPRYVRSKNMSHRLRTSLVGAVTKMNFNPVDGQLDNPSSRRLSIPW